LARIGYNSTTVLTKAVLRVAIALALLTFLVSLFLMRTVIPAAGRLSHGFLACYVGAQTIKDGEPGTRLYDNKWFAARVMAVSGGQVTDIYLPDPPALAVAWLPFASMSAEVARRLWVGLSVLWLGCALALVARTLSWPRSLFVLVGLTALFTLPAPTREQFHNGQMYAFLLLLHTIGWRAYSRRHDAGAGVALGLAMVLKLSGWPIGLLMIAQRRWTAVRWAIVTGVAAVIVTLPWVGIDAWRALVFVAIPDALQWPAATLTAYQDTSGFWQHWFRYDAQLNPNPIVNAPALASLLTIGTTVVALIALLSPIAEQYHYTVLLLPLAVLWHEAWLFRNRAALCCALLATFLIAWPMDYKAPHPAWALLLSYPRLFGGWISFAALLTPWRDKNGAIRNLRSAFFGRTGATL
jgi:Glycosyltransferase family 87